MTDEERQRIIEKACVKDMASTANRVIDQTIYESLRKERKKIDPLLKKIEKDIDRQNFKQHFKNLLAQYGKKDDIPDAQRAQLTQILKDNIEPNAKRDLLKDFKKAFQLATNIREIVTGQEIVFSVVESTANGQITTVQLNTSQMVKRLELVPESVGHMSSNILSAIKAVQDKSVRTRHIKKLSYSTQSNLYKSIVTFFEGMTRYTGKQLNKGTRWQMFYYFYDKYKDDSVTITDTEQLLAGYFLAKAGYAWYTGGDVGNTQVKYTGASFTSFNSVVTILKKFKSTFDKTEKKSMEKRNQELQKLFYIDNDKQIKDLGKKINKTFKDKTIEGLKQEIAKIDFDTITVT